MIYVTRLNHTRVVLNCDLIEYIETTPDTVISLTTGQKLIVLESPEQIVASVVRHRHAIRTGQMEHRPEPAQDGGGGVREGSGGNGGR